MRSKLETLSLPPTYPSIYSPHLCRSKYLSQNPKIFSPKILTGIFDPLNFIIFFRPLDLSRRDLSIPTNLISFNPPYLEKIDPEDFRSDRENCRLQLARFSKSKSFWWVATSFNSLQLTYGDFSFKVRIYVFKIDSILSHPEPNRPRRWSRIAAPSTWKLFLLSRAFRNRKSHLV
jgi:hypothetical protein